ncbi:MAG: calcium-binding protein [Actinomycetota bacterium]
MPILSRSLVVAVAAGLALVLPALPAGAQTAPRCTITGTAGNDTLRGTAGNDVLCGLGGNDTITGLGGDDTLLGGPGNDVLDGGLGNDVLDGSTGNDRLTGGDGDDRLAGGDGNDVLVGDLGNDRADGGPGTDGADVTTAGGPVRADLVAGTATGLGSDVLAGIENVTGGPAGDVLVGDAGVNRLDGGGGNDVVTGGAGNDTVVGGMGNDRLAGGDGADLLDPGSGTNVCQAGDRMVGACTVDTAGPSISGFSVPAVVRAGDSVTFTFRLVDPAGVQNAGISVGWNPGLYTGCGFNQSATLVSGTAFDGQWRYMCTFPPDAVATEYSAQVSATDNFGNWAASEWGYFRIDGPNTDAAPPQPADVQLVGTARIGELLTITWRMTDASAIDGAFMWVAAPGGFFADSSYRLYADYGLPVERRCNTAATSCTFTQTVRLAPFGTPGQWSLWLSARDVYANKDFEAVLAFPVLAPATSATSPTTVPATGPPAPTVTTTPITAPPAVAPTTTTSTTTTTGVPAGR